MPGLAHVHPPVGEPHRGREPVAAPSLSRYTSCGSSPAASASRPARAGARVGARRRLALSTRAATAVNLARSAGSASSASTGTPSWSARARIASTSGRAGSRPRESTRAAPGRPAPARPVPARRAGTAAPSPRSGRAARTGRAVRPRSRARPRRVRRPRCSSPPRTHRSAPGSSPPGPTRRRASPPRSPRRPPPGTPGWDVAGPAAGAQPGRTRLRTAKASHTRPM